MTVKYYIVHIKIGQKSGKMNMVLIWWRKEYTHNRQSRKRYSSNNMKMRTIDFMMAIFIIWTRTTNNFANKGIMEGLLTIFIEVFIKILNQSILIVVTQDNVYRNYRPGHILNNTGIIWNIRVKTLNSEYTRYM